MRLSYRGTGRFQEDEETVLPGESFEVSDERGAELLARFPDDISRSAPQTSSSPSAQATEVTAPSDSTGASD